MHDLYKPQEERRMIKNSETGDKQRLRQKN
jgi:hypothetical protein